MTKENNGRAARSRLQRKLLMIITFFLCLVAILSILMPKNGHETSPNEAAAETSRHLLSGLRDAGSLLRKHKARSNVLMGRQHDGMRILTSADDDGDEDWQAILKAQVHLVDLIVNEDEVDLTTSSSSDTSYGGIYGVFCEINWDAHKEDPASVPMFRDLLQHSPGCDRHRVKVDLATAVDRMREYDESSNDTNILDLTGVVFHESRCGSTLVANLLASMNPTAHRVYSESAPPITALFHVCGETYGKCSKETAARVLQDVIYAMSRSNDPSEERVFFKIQSAGTRNLPVFTTGFPDTPWLFVYRDPVEIMMSHLPSNLRSIRQSNCVRQQLHGPPALVKTVLEHHFPGQMTRDIAPVEYCAAHLASITNQAVESLEETSSRGRPVNYKDLPAALWTDILPHHWKVEPTSAEIRNMQVTSGQYSKGRDGQKKKGAFTEDSAKKQASASPEIRAAAQAILNESFLALEDMAAEAKTATE